MRNILKISKRGNWLLLVGLLTFIISVFLTSRFTVNTVQAHAGYERSDPPANARLPEGKPPAQIKVWFTETLEPKFSKLSVVNQNRESVDNGDSKVLVNEPKAMVVTLKADLPDGAYTVLTEAASNEDGHVIKGSFAFVVGLGALPTTATQSPLDIAEKGNDAATSNVTFWSVSLRWLNYLAGAALVGALSYGLLVWRRMVANAKATKRIGPQLDTAFHKGVKRIAFVVWLSLGSLLVGWLGWFLYQAGNFSNQNLMQLFGYGVEQGGRGSQALTDFLFGTRYGQVWVLRLGILVLAILSWTVATNFNKTGSLLTTNSTNKILGAKLFQKNLLPSEEISNIPPANSNTPKVATSEGQFSPVWWQWWVTTVLGGGILFTGSLNSHAAGVNNWAWLAVGADWLHLMATATWVGGLLVLALSLATAIGVLLPGTGDRTRLLAVVIPLFSQIGVLSVAILFLTGTFQTALHLSDFLELFTTPYGLSLTIKLALLLPLLLLAAYNLLVASPRLRAFARSKKAGPKEGAGSVEAGQLGLNFRRSVWAEIVIASVVLLSVAFLTSNSPPKNVAASTKALYFQAQPGDLKVDFAIAPGGVGENTFEARLVEKTSGRPVPATRAVYIRLEHKGMDMGEPRLELKATGRDDGRYIGQGPILSMSGEWEATLVVQRDGYDDVQMAVSFKVGQTTGSTKTCADIIGVELGCS
jgi:copper transport protein